MLKLSHFFMLFFLCNTTIVLDAMNRDAGALEDSSNAQEYREIKEAARRKKERQKKHQNSYRKTSDGNILKAYPTKTTK